MKIGFTSNSKNVISQAIIGFTGYQAKVFPVASHCFPILGVLHGIELGLSADEVTISIIDVDRYRKDSDYVLRIYEIPDVIPHETWVKFILDTANEKIYPHLELVWFVYQFFKDQILPDDPSDKNWLDYSYFCSELTVETLKSGGYSGWFKGFDPNSMSPAVVENLVSSIPHAKLIENRS